MIQFFSYQMLFTFFFIFLTWKIWKKYNSKTPKLPPGPWRLPIIGSIHHLIHPLLHRRLQELTKKYGPIMHLQLGEVPTVIISSPEAAKQIMKTHDIIFADRPFFLATDIATYNGQDIGGAPYGERWRQLRKICTLELLTMKRVQSFRSIREEEVLEMVKSIASNAGSLVNVSELVGSMTYGIISRAAFGKVWNGKDVFVPSVKKLIEAASGFNFGDIYPSIKLLHVISGVRPKLQKIQNGIDAILEDVLKEHKAKRANKSRKADANEEEMQDLIDVLLNFQDNGNLQIPLTDESVKAVIMDMFTAGSETSSTVIDWAMAEMMKNPRVLKKAQEEVRQVLGTKVGTQEEGLQELKYLNLVVKETLRMHAPIPLLLPRECREDCVINGYDIKAKTRVVVNVWAMARDPDYWVDANKFYPERFIDSNIDYKGINFEFLPFGAGRRMCPGIAFGIADVEFPLAMLLYHFDWELPKGLKPENFDMTESFGAVVRKKDELLLIPTPYSSFLVN